MMIRRNFKAKIAYTPIVSEYGWFHDLRMVGRKEKISAMLIKIIGHNRLSVKKYNPNANKASPKNTISLLVMLSIPYLKNAYHATMIQIQAATALDHDHAHAPSDRCQKKTIPAPSHRMIRLKICGLVVPWNISLI